MANWRDVMEARQTAEDARGAAQAYGGSIEDGRSSDAALATLLAAEAICAELRALAVLLDQTVAAAGRGES